MFQKLSWCKIKHVFPTHQAWRCLFSGYLLAECSCFTAVCHPFGNRRAKIGKSEQKAATLQDTEPRRRTEKTPHPRGDPLASWWDYLPGQDPLTLNVCCITVIRRAFFFKSNRHAEWNQFGCWYLESKVKLVNTLHRTPSTDSSWGPGLLRGRERLYVITCSAGDNAFFAWASLEVTKQA